MVVKSGWETMAGSFLTAAAPIGSKTATIFEIKIAIVKVPATKPETLIALMKNSVVQQLPCQIFPGVFGIGFTIPVYCSIVNHKNPKIPTKTAIIAAETASFLKILKKSFGVSLIPNPSKVTLQEKPLVMLLAYLSRRLIAVLSH